MAVEKLETCDQLKWEEAVEYAWIRSNYQTYYTICGMVGITGLKKMKMYKNVYSYSTITFIKSLDIQLKDYFHHMFIIRMKIHYTVQKLQKCHWLKCY